MTATQSLRFIDFFKHHTTLNQSNVNEFLGIVDEVVKEEVKVIREVVATKVEVNLINKDLQLLQQETRNEFNLLRKENAAEFTLLRQEIKTLNAELRAEIKGDLNKHLIWTFGLLLTIATLALGIAKLIF